MKHRHQLRAKEQRALREQLAATPAILHRALTGEGGRRTPVERIMLEDKTELFLVEGQLWLIRRPDLLFPALPALLDHAVELPKVVVDMGAVPHIANGADVMAPGIVEIDRSVKQGDLVVIIDQKNQTPLAVGMMLMNADELQEQTKGRAIQSLHHVGDRLWTLMKSLSE